MNVFFCQDPDSDCATGHPVKVAKVGILAVHDDDADSGAAAAGDHVFAPGPDLDL